VNRLLTLVFTFAVATLATLGCGLALLTGTAAPGCQPTGTPNAAANSGGRPVATAGSTSNWTREQVDNAATILDVGQHLGVPARGQVIALAAAMQESSLRSLPGGDRDSLGLFQQRPSAGWGTPDQIRDPVYSATRFYRTLLAVPGWQAMPVTQAAQDVQRSAYPNAYADDEPAAIQLFAALTGPGPAGLGAIPGCPDTAQVDATLPAGVSLAAASASATAGRAIMWAMAQLGTPYSYGGDCTDAHSGNPARQCDCSSLTQRAFAHAGASLPRTAAEQSHVGRPVALDHLQPGDLLFSAGADGTPHAPGHVALYLGNGYLIEAPHTGATVRLAPLTPARRAALVGARRPAA
jgi:cell wall-associated NlpC family hydrolase